MLRMQFGIIVNQPLDLGPNIIMKFVGREGNELVAIVWLIDFISF